MVEGYLKVCSDEDLNKIHDAVLRILEKVGLKVPSNLLLDFLQDYGAKVDRKKMRVRFPPQIVEKTIQLSQRQRRGMEDPLITRKMQAKFAQDFGYETFFLYDWEKKERRPATLKEVVELIHLGDVLPEVTSVGLPVLNSETDQKVEAIEACELLYLHTRKHRGSGIRTPEQVKYMIEIDKILGYGPENTHFVQVGRCMISPLNFSLDAARIFEELIKYGYTHRFWVATMPISGATSPVTMAGNIALAAAEILGGWSIAKAINPEAKVGATVISGVMDMKTGKASFAAPEATIQDAGVCQLFKRLYKVEIGYDPGGYIDAKVPGIQAAYERTFKHMALGTTVGVALTIGALDGASTFSPEQAILDLEFNKGLWKFFEGLEVTDETIALEEIEKVGMGERKTFLECEHTLKHYQEVLWEPELLDRGPWEKGKEEKLLQKAHEKWREMLKNYSPPQVDREKAKAIHEVVERARKELLRN